MVWASLAGVQGCDSCPVDVRLSGMAQFEAGESIACSDGGVGAGILEPQSEERGITKTLPRTQDALGFYATGIGGAIAVADLDADSDLDFVAGGLDEILHFYLNDGSGNFSLYTRDVGPLLRTGSIVFANSLVDLDGDYLPELVIVGPETIWILKNEGDLEWSRWAEVTPFEVASGHVYQTLMFGDLDLDGDLDLVLPSMEPVGLEPGSISTGSPDSVFLQVAEGEFERIADLNESPNESRVQMGLLTDRDWDGDLDIMLLNDKGPPSTFWRNDGFGENGLVLGEDSEAIHANLDMAAMGIVSMDFNEDGDLDYCISDVGNPRCLLSDGAGGFYEGGASLGIKVDKRSSVRVATVGWSLELADLDNSGWPELLQASGPDPGSYENGLLEVADALWWADDEGQWRDMSAESGFDSEQNHIGLVSGDFDSDGAVEIVVAGPGDVPHFYDNGCSETAWVELELLGPPGNTEAYGAKVEVYFGDRVDIREVVGLRNKAQSASRLHFGLGEASAIDLIRVTWPDGRIAETDRMGMRQRITVRHPDAPEMAVQEWSEDLRESGLLLLEETAIGGQVVGFTGSPIENIRVSTLDGEEVFTNSSGYFSMPVSVVEDEDLYIEPSEQGTDYIRLISAVAERGERNALRFQLLMEEQFEMLHSMTNQAREAEAGAVWVTMSGTDEAIEFSLDVAHTGSAVYVGNEFEERSTLTEDDKVLFFFNVTPGEVTLVREPDLVGCEGRETLPVKQGRVTWVHLKCGAGG